MNVFARPMMLWLLLIVPVLGLWVVRGAVRRRTDWQALGQSRRLVADGAVGWLGAMACLIVALAAPRWGLDSSSSLPRGHDLVLAVDVSRSMGAEDAVPNRLSVAVETAESLLSALGRDPGSRVAVVAFAGRARLRCPLTENLGAADEALRALRPGDVRPGGTDLGAAVLTAIEAFDDQEHAEGRTILLFSDGEDHAGSWPSTLERLRGQGIVVHSVAIGDARQGHPVPLGSGPATLSYQGKAVLSRRDDRPFDALAQATGGAVVRVGLSPADLGELFLDRIAPVARRQHELLRAPERAERFSLFLFAALGLGLGGSWASRRRRPAFRGWLAAAAFAAIGASDRSELPSTAVEEGRAHYAAGRFAQALAAFERAIALAPADAVPRYDAAAALFQLERYPEALAQYQQAREAAGSTLRPKIDFAMGNTALALGDARAAIEHYDACLASSGSSAAVDRVRRDAAINRRYAEEHAQEAQAPPPSQDRNEGSRGPSPDGKEGNEGQDGQPGDRSNPSGLGPSGRRGPGGAGGTGSDAGRTGSPQERLALALENIKQARERRIEDVAPPPDENRKDW